MHGACPSQDESGQSHHLLCRFGVGLAGQNSCQGSVEGSGAMVSSIIVEVTKIVATSS